MNITIWAHLCLFTVGSLPAAIDAASHVARTNSSVFMCVLCCCVLHCPVATYCVINTQQNFCLINDHYCSMKDGLSCTLSWHCKDLHLKRWREGEFEKPLRTDIADIATRLWIRQLLEAWPKEIDHCSISSKLLEPKAQTVKQRKTSVSLTVTIALAVVRKAGFCHVPWVN